MNEFEHEQYYTKMHKVGDTRALWTICEKPETFNKTSNAIKEWTLNCNRKKGTIS